MSPVPTRDLSQRDNITTMEGQGCLECPGTSPLTVDTHTQDREMNVQGWEDASTSEAFIFQAQGP